MLEKIELEKYRCFEKTKMSVRELTVIVGKNNSGKSSFIEALRMIAMATRKCAYTKYIYLPESLNLPLQTKGFRLPVEQLRIDLRGVVYYYQAETAKITATFKGNIKIVVYINEDVAFATLLDHEGNFITSKAQARAIQIGMISILPQIGLIKENEKKLADNTIVQDLDTYLSSLHFRNEMLMYRDNFNDFKKLAEETWPGLRVRSLEYDGLRSEYIGLFIEDANFPAEIGLMGSGIQMWLQIIWFICRSKENETIILDEPDVYMHPELQLKMLKIVKSMFTQVIIATHSVEMITNVSPRNIITIDKKDRQMRYANQLEMVQNIVNDIGSDYNLSLIKLGSAKKCIFVEGEDIKILQEFYSVLNPDSIYSFDTIPSLPLGGFKRINEAFGAAKLFYNNSKGQFKCYAILDRDYYSDMQLDELKGKAFENHLILHIWDKKEIENYILKPSILFRLLEKTEIDYCGFVNSFETLVDSFKEATIDSYTTKIQEENRKLAAGTAAMQARSFVNSNWANLDAKLKIISGKDLLSATYKWMKEKYRVSCSMKSIFNAMKADDVDNEMIELIELLS